MSKGAPRTADVPATRLGKPGGFLEAIDEHDLVHFVLNVGDGDTQLLLLPEEEGARRAIVVDIRSATKLERLIKSLREAGLLPTTEAPGGPKSFALVVATHPHADHISGMASFIGNNAGRIAEFWEPGYIVPGQGYSEMMTALRENRQIDHAQPSSGTVRFVDHVKLTVLSPGIALKNRYDSYGIDVNNSSIAMRLDFPSQRYYKKGEHGEYEELPKGASIVLGADAQTLSWAQVVVDFPQLDAKDTIVSEALKKARGVNPLNADVFKVSHHASKHGLNLELVERIAPTVSLVSCADRGRSYNFPHLVCLEALREGLEKTTKYESPRSPDYDLGIHFTFGKDTANATLGSIAVVLSPSGRKHDVWRFGDSRSATVNLAAGRKFD